MPWKTKQNKSKARESGEQGRGGYRHFALSSEEEVSLSSESM